MIKSLIFVHCKCKPTSRCPDAERLTRKDTQYLKLGTFNHLFEDIFIACKLQFAAGNVRLAGLEAETRSASSSFADTYVNVC